MIRADCKYDFATATWSLTGKVKSTTSRLKSKGYVLDRYYLSWQYNHYREAPKLAPVVLTTWSK